MTRTLWNVCPSYLGLNQLVTILIDLALMAVKTVNRKMLKKAERYKRLRAKTDDTMGFIWQEDHGENCLSTVLVVPLLIPSRKHRELLLKSTGITLLLLVVAVGRFVRLLSGF